jgi:tRNA U34 5-methylaminomethyl-2-thiouridine-forming methyltransferase MnmC
MTWPACGAEPPGGAAAGAASATPEAEPGGLAIRQGGDGSFSLWSEAFGEGFHSGRGALREARETFLAPSQLERFRPGQRLTVVEVGVGTGTNTAVLLEACAAQGLELEWWGLELDPAPLTLSLRQPAFRRPWPPTVLERLEELGRHDGWRSGSGPGSGQVLWGDARQRLPGLLAHRRGQVDLIWHDAFSPRHCPQLWTVEFLGALTALLAPHGRWISYCSAAAVRQTLLQQGLQLAALAVPAGPMEGQSRPGWSGGSLASPEPWALSPLWRPLTTMEREHLRSAAGEPYRDPSGAAPAAVILAARQQAQTAALARGIRRSSGAWRRRWQLERSPGA